MKIPKPPEVLVIWAWLMIGVLVAGLYGLIAAGASFILFNTIDGWCLYRAKRLIEDAIIQQMQEVYDLKFPDGDDTFPRPSRETYVATLFVGMDFDMGQGIRLYWAVATGRFQLPPPPQILEKVEEDAANE